MAIQTPTTRVDNIAGSLRQVIATFASISNGDTWPTGLGLISGVSIDPGTATSIGATLSGGTVTFATSGAVTNVQVLAFGY